MVETENTISRIEHPGSKTTQPLAIIETHPIQYRSPVYRVLREKYGVPVNVVYGSDFSVAGSYDREFQSTFSWDTDLLSGYDHRFLCHSASGQGTSFETVPARGLSSLLTKMNPRAVLLTGYSPRFHQWAWAHALRLGRPILFRGETAERAQTAGTIRLKLRARMLRLLYSRCGRILYIGKQARQHFADHGCSPEKLVFSPYCVDATPMRTDEVSRRDLRDATRAELGISEEQTVLLFSGKLSARKGPDLIPGAVRMLPAEQRKRTVIVFLGNGELSDSIEAQARLEPEVAVRFAGFRNQKEISRFYHAADLLILPSLRLETWGLVVNEALHHGLPCVVSDSVGCAPDLVIPGMTGAIAETGVASALMRAIERAISLTGCPEVRRKCREHVEGYSVDRAAAGIARAWEECVA